MYLTNRQEYIAKGLMGLLAKESCPLLSDEQSRLLSRMIAKYYESDTVMYDPSIPKYSACPAAELYHQAVLFREGFTTDSAPGQHYKKAVFLVMEDGQICLGYYKLKNERTFLSAVTVKRTDGTYPLIKGGLYSLDKAIYEDIPDNEGHWLIKRVDSLRVNPLRMLLTGTIEMRFHNTAHTDLDLIRRAVELSEAAGQASFAEPSSDFRIIR